jgi:transcriptional regulator with XRE-family HTH domain
MTGTTGTAVPKRQLGMALRRCREAQSLDRDAAAGALECSESKISRIEAGVVGMKATELRELLDLYQVTGKEREDLEQLRVQTSKRRKPTTYGTAVPDWFRRYVSLEEGATEIRTYSVEPIEGLLQTEDYARAVIEASTLPAPGDGERLVAARMARQDRLAGDDPIQVHAVLTEGALRTEIGGPDVMRDQVKHVRKLADLPNVTIQVCPFKSGAHAATGFPFILLRLPNSDGLDVVYLEDQTSARYYDNDPVEQQRYGVIWSHLIRSALTPAESKRFLTALAR